MNTVPGMSPTSAAAALHQQLQRQVSAAVVPLAQPPHVSTPALPPGMLTGQPPGPPRMPPQAAEPPKETLPEIPPIPEELRRPLGMSDINHGVGMTADTRKADDRVNSLMASLFRSEVTANQVLSRVKEAFGSDDPQQKEFYRYFMKVVSEEFVHIPVQFPEVEATLMAHLYGGIINEGVGMMAHSLLSYFIRLLWMAVGRELNTAYDERMFVVGITAFWVARVTIKSFKMLAQKMMQSINFYLYPHDLREIVIQTATEAATQQLQHLSFNVPISTSTAPALLPPQSQQTQQAQNQVQHAQPPPQSGSAIENQPMSLLKGPNSDALVMVSEIMKLWCFASNSQLMRIQTFCFLPDRHTSNAKEYSLRVLCFKNLS